MRLEDETREGLEEEMLLVVAVVVVGIKRVTPW